MPTSPFDRALAWVLKAEGGYYDGSGAHDPNPTMCGITQKTYDRWRTTSGKEKRPVRQIGMDEIASIYRVGYWTKGKCDKLAEKSETIATIHFDACVNHGVASPNNNKSSGAIELFQRAVGVEDDGVFGPQTMGAFLELLADDGEEAVAGRYLKAREAQYRYLAEKAPRTLGLNLKGWLKRLEHLKKHLKLVVVLLVAMTMLTATVEAQKVTLGNRTYHWPPPNAERVEPDSLWVVQYKEAERCLGWEGDVDKVQWHLVPGRSFHDDEGREVIGYWVKPHKIYLAADAKNLRWLARHESIHDLLQNGLHPTGVFGKLCAAAWGYLTTNGDLGE